MRIVHQSAADFYSSFLFSPFLLLPAPVIAGLLPAPKPIPEPTPIDRKVPPFTYSSPFTADLDESQREAIYDAVRALIDVAVQFTRGTLNDHAVLTAIMMYRQAIATEPIKARNPAEFKALMDTPMLQYMIERARHTAPEHTAAVRS